MRMVMLLSQLVPASAVEMVLRIRTAPPRYPRTRAENTGRVVVSYTDCLSLVYSSLPGSILYKAEMMLNGPEPFSALFISSLKSPVRLKRVVPFPMKRISGDLECSHVFV